MRIPILSAQRREEDGQVLVLFALCSFVLVGAMALALDVGFLLSERRAAQNAADAAALAGGVALVADESHGDVSAAANDYVALNEIPVTGPDAANVDVTVTGTSRDGVVEVELTVPVQRFFVGAVYTGAWRVTARAVAEINDNHDGDYALIALEEPGMYVNGDIRIDIIDGSAMSNGDIDRSGGANFFLTDGTIDAHGTVNPNSNWQAPDGIYGNRATVDNPFDGIVPPDPSLLTEITSFPDCNSDCTLDPGYYNGLGDQTIKRTATLNPGIYYFEGTSISMQNTNSRIEGDDVMLYFTGSPGSTYFDPKNGEVNLEAPPTSPYAGGQDNIVLWIENCTEFDSQGNEEFYLGGIFLAPCSDVTLHGNPFGETIHGQVIVGTLDIRGTSDFIIRYSDDIDTPRYMLALVE